MTHSDDFAARLHDGMLDATHDLHAHGDLTERLIATASDPDHGRSRTPMGRSLRTSRYFTTWVLPAAAALVTVVAAGSVAVAHQFALGDSVTPGDGIVVPGRSAATSQPAPPSDPARPTPHRSVPARRPSSAPPHSTGPTASSGPRAALPAPATSRSRSAARSAAPGPSAADSSPPTTAPPAPPASCSTPDTGEYRPTSLPDFEHHLTGTWLLCSTPSVFGTDEAGLRISPDGTWAKLTRDADGQLVAGTSSGEKGDWDAVDDTAANGGRPTFQLDLHIDGSGTVIALAHISTGVDRVSLDNNGVYEASYVPTSEAVH